MGSEMCIRDRGSMKMGRSSVSGLRVTIFGSSGFLGRYVVSRLGAVGCQMVLPYRGDELYMRHLKPMADLGAINFVKGTIRSLEDIQAAVEGSNVVINLLGLRQETRCAGRAERPDETPYMQTFASRSHYFCSAQQTHTYPPIVGLHR